MILILFFIHIIFELLSNNNRLKIMYNLIVAMITTVKTQTEQPSYLERNDIANYILNIDFALGNSTSEK